MASLKDMGVNLENITKEAQSAYDEVVSNFDDYSTESDRAEYRIETLGSGAAGTQQAESIIKAYDIPLDKEADNKESDEEYINEFGWEIVEGYFDEIAKELRETIKIQTKPGYEIYNFWFGNDENDGDYCLFIGVDKSNEVTESSNPLIDQANKILLKE